MVLPAIGWGAAAALGGGTAIAGIANAFGQSEAGKAQAEATKEAARLAAEKTEKELAFNAALPFVLSGTSFGHDLAFTGFEAYDPAARKVKSDRAMYNMIQSGMSPDQVAWGGKMLGGFVGPSVAGKYRSQFNPIGA